MSDGERKPGRPRLSTVLLIVAFVATAALYLVVRPDPLRTVTAVPDAVVPTAPPPVTGAPPDGDEPAPTEAPPTPTSTVPTPSTTVDGTDPGPEPPTTTTIPDATTPTTSAPPAGG